MSNIISGTIQMLLVLFDCYLYFQQWPYIVLESIKLLLEKGSIN